MASSNNNNTSRPVSPSASSMSASLRVSKALLEPVLNNPSRIRNVCILAHVDHGKTTMTDLLLASNGIISFKQAGKLRYLDSREDEQERGITMEASAITLLYDMSVMGEEQQQRVERHAINLIDSPGHVDFARQVVTAARICDGCLVLVDAVEGVCTQTMAVLRQAKRERLTPCLVINKIDRLIVELKYSTIDAYSWLNKLIQQVNAVYATIQADVSSDMCDNLLPIQKEEEKEDGCTFDPLLGNVLFASSTDGWAFSIERFVQFYAKKLEMKSTVLRQTLWGDFFFDSKQRKVLPKSASGDPGKAMFTQFCLDPIWSIYEATSAENWDTERIERISLQVGAKLPPREMKTKDSKALLRSLLGQWLSLPDTIFSAIVTQIPSPLEANRIRLASLFSPQWLDNLHNGDCSPSPQTALLLKNFLSPENPLDPPVIALVSKLFSLSPSPSRLTASTSMESLNKGVLEMDLSSGGGIESAEKLIGMARLFHGTITVGQTIYILGSKHVPGSREAGAVEFVIGELYLLMGRDLEPVQKVYAGAVFGIGGLAPYVGKSATLSSTLDCPSLEPQRTDNPPIVQVALRPAELSRLPQMIAGLQLLCQADPCAESHLQEENGEQILATAGELHLEQCLKDLKERYTPPGTELIVSPPMVPFRETISAERSRNQQLCKQFLGADDTLQEDNGLITLTSTDGHCRIGLRAFPLPLELISFIFANRLQIRQAMTERTTIEECGRLVEELKRLWDSLSANGQSWKNGLDVHKIWSFGPRYAGPNLLFCTVPGENNADGSRGTRAFFKPSAELEPFQTSIITGFQVATEKGPLAHEPLQGVGFVLESFQLLDWPEGEGREEEQCQARSLLTGQLIPLFRTLCEAAFLFWSPRLMLAIYQCSIQTTSHMLGRVHAALSKRRGKVTAEEYHEGTGFFTIHARLPVVESFGFADDLRTRTSGVAIPQLVFAGFETLDEDPYWIPLTDEEFEDFGEMIKGRENLAMRYLIKIRERKGLFVERKIVQFAEKQRTLRR